ncbi:MAG: hypothetical protein ABL308_07445 [Oceanicaulis sp.]
MGLEFLPECASAPPRARRRYFFRSTLAGLVFAASIVVGFAVLEPGMVRLAVLGLGLLAVAAGFYEFYRLMAALDELQRQIHTTAMSFAGAIVIGIATVWSVLSAALDGPQAEAIFAIPVWAAAYYLSLFFVARRFA